MGAVLDRTILRTPFDRAGYRFILRTLARSPRHRLVLAAFLGAGAILSLQVLGNGSHESTGMSPSVAWLSVGYILNFCLIAGLRFVFDMPAELRANWTFQLLANAGSRCMPLARMAIWSAVIAATWTVELGIYVAKFGWRVAVCNAVVLTLMSMLLADAAVGNFRKLAFTCSYPTFKQNAIAGVVVMGLGFTAFTFGVAAIEHWAFVHWWRWTVFVPMLAGGWYAVGEYRESISEEERELTFEEAPFEVQLLNLDAR